MRSLAAQGIRALVFNQRKDTNLRLLYPLFEYVKQRIQEEGYSLLRLKVVQSTTFRRKGYRLRREKRSMRLFYPFLRIEGTQTAC